MALLMTQLLFLLLALLLLNFATLPYILQYYIYTVLTELPWSGGGGAESVLDVSVQCSVNLVSTCEGLQLTLVSACEYSCMYFELVPVWYYII